MRPDDATLASRLGSLTLTLALLLACEGSGSTPNQPGASAAAAAGHTTTTAGGSTPNAGGAGGAQAGAPSLGGAAGSSLSGGSGGQLASGGAVASGAAGTSGGGVTGSGGAPWAFPAGVTKPRIMIVGDSISAGPGCYKKYLLKNLTDNDYTSFEFIGEYADDCEGKVRHSAVSCSTAEQYTLPAFTMPNCSSGMSFPGMSALVTKHDPDLIMLQLGVNDVWGGKATQAILDNYELLVEQARAHNPKIVLVVARIQKIRPDCSNDDAVTKRAEALVNAVPAWAQGLSTADSPLFVADLWTNSDYSRAETNDCVHPNDVGAQKMGLNWFNALKGILKPG